MFRAVLVDKKVDVCFLVYLYIKNYNIYGKIRIGDDINGFKKSCY